MSDLDTEYSRWHEQRDTDSQREAFKAGWERRVGVETRPLSSKQWSRIVELSRAVYDESFPESCELLLLVTEIQERLVVETTKPRVCPDSDDGNHVLKQDGPFSVVYCDACGMNRGFRETAHEAEMVECPDCRGTGGGPLPDGVVLDCSRCNGYGGVPRGTVKTGREPAFDPDVRVLSSEEVARGLTLNNIATFAYPPWHRKRYCDSGLRLMGISDTRTAKP